MFEKEAEEYGKENCTIQKNGLCMFVDSERTSKIWKDGAEFGYNKANEWHYVKDELPERFYKVLICLKKKKRFTRLTMAVRVKKNLWTSLIGDIGTKEIIAWKRKSATCGRF